MTPYQNSLYWMNKLHIPTDCGRKMPEGLDTTRWLLWTMLHPEFSEPEGPLSNRADQSLAEILAEAGAVVIFTAYVSAGSYYSYGGRHQAAVRNCGADWVTAVVLGVY